MASKQILHLMKTGNGRMGIVAYLKSMSYSF